MASGVFNNMLRTKTWTPEIKETNLKRCLSAFDLTLLGISGMVGAGLFVLTGIVAKNIAGPAIIVSYSIAGFSSLLVALCYAEFGTRIPKAGAAYTFTYLCLGEASAFLMGWNIILEHLVGGASVSRAWSAYLDEMTDYTIKNLTMMYINWPSDSELLAEYPDFLAIIPLLFVVVLISLGIHGSAAFNNVITVLNIVTILLIVVAGMTQADISNWTEVEGGFVPFGVDGVFLGAATCFFAYVGFDTISTSAEESTNPTKSVPLATFWAFTITTVSYVTVAATLTLMIPYNEIEAESALSDAFKQHGMDWARYIVDVAAITAMTTSVLTSIYAATRCVYAMSSDGLLFAFLSDVNPRTQTPVKNTATLGLMGIVLVVLFDLEALVSFLSIGTILVYTIVVVALMVMRYSSLAYTLTVQPAEEYQEPGDSAEPKPKSNSPKSRRRQPTKEVDPTGIDGYPGTVKNPFAWIPLLKNAYPGRVVSICVYLYTITCAFLGALLSYGSEFVFKKQTWWALLLLLLFILVLVACFVTICMHHHYQSSNAFQVPWTPFIQCLSIFLNLYLMMTMTLATWLRFGIWIVLGMVTYFAYGMPHSKEGEQNQQQYMFLEENSQPNSGSTTEINGAAAYQTFNK